MRILARARLIPMRKDRRQFLSCAVSGLAGLCSLGFKGAVAQWESPREIFLLAGQSNMSGRAPLAGLPAFRHIDRVRTYRNSGEWTSTAEPIDDRDRSVYPVGDDDASASPGSAFGDRLAELRPNAVIGLVPCARGATGIDQWARNLSTSALYGAMIARARAAASDGELKGLIWFQGESDAANATLANAWPGKFNRLVADVRSDLRHARLPVVMTVLGPDPNRSDFPAWPIIVERQRTMALPDNCVRVSAQDLAGQPNDPIHLDTPSIVTLGRRWAEALHALL